MKPHVCIPSHGLLFAGLLAVALAGCTQGGGGGAPVAPSSTATGSVTLQWDPGADADLAGYRVYRSTTSQSYGAPIATLPASTTSFQATNLSKGETYFFVVSAYDGNGNESPFSNEVSRTVQ